jgi:hypothetical protein
MADRDGRRGIVVGIMLSLLVLGEGTAALVFAAGVEGFCCSRDNIVHSAVLGEGMCVASLVVS